MTPFGRGSANADAPVTDLTILAGAGPVWSCGYDDHALPPVRGGGNQGYHTGCHFAVMSALTALLYRVNSGEGQFIDVSMHAASNVTTEAASYTWLVAQQTVQRQTGRHAAAIPTGTPRCCCKDGRWVNTGVPPRYAGRVRPHAELAARAGTGGAVPRRGVPGDGRGAATGQITYDLIGVDDEVTAIFVAGRAALALIAANVSAYDFFIGCQRRGLAVGVDLFAGGGVRGRALQRPRLPGRGDATRTWAGRSATPARPTNCRPAPGPSPGARRSWANTTPRSWAR